MLYAHSSMTIYNEVNFILQECEFLCLLASYFNKDAHHAYNFVRDLIIKDTNNNKLWNLFNLIITASDETRHNKFLMRQTSKNPDRYLKCH
jgi:hypothetical protein